MDPSGRQRDPGLLPLFTRRARPNIFLIGCRWRIELATLALVTGGLLAAIHAFGATATFSGLAVAASAAAFAAATSPSARQFAMAAVWTVITPHRVRTCFARNWVYNSSGKTPAVIRATATPSGERVLVLCVAGTSVEDIEAVSSSLAASCWAAHVVVTRSERFAHVVSIDVIRRPAQPPPAGAEQAAGEPDPWTPPWPDDKPGAPGAPRKPGPLDDDDTPDAELPAPRIVPPARAQRPGSGPSLPCTGLRALPGPAGHAEDIGPGRHLGAVPALPELRQHVQRRWRWLVAMPGRRGHVVVVDCELVDAKQDLQRHRDGAELVGHQLTAVPQRRAESGHRGAQLAARVAALVGPHRPEVLGGELRDLERCREVARTALQQHRVEPGERAHQVDRDLADSPVRAAGRQLLPAGQGGIGEVTVEFRAQQPGSVGPRLRRRGLTHRGFPPRRPR